jgi:hypothetical protein
VVYWTVRNTEHWTIFYFLMDFTPLSANRNELCDMIKLEFVPSPQHTLHSHSKLHWHKKYKLKHLHFFIWTSALCSQTCKWYLIIVNNHGHVFDLYLFSCKGFSQACERLFGRESEKSCTTKILNCVCFALVFDSTPFFSRTINIGRQISVCVSMLVLKRVGQGLF